MSYRHLTLPISIVSHYQYALKLPSLDSGRGAFARVALGKARRGLAQPPRIDAARARQIAHGKVERRKRHVFGEALVPRAARVRGGDQLLQDRPARGFERRERRRRVGRVRGERAVERDWVLHGKPVAGADREMRRMQRIADEDMAIVPPARVSYDRESAPHRVIANEGVALESVGEHARAQRGGLRLAHALKAGAPERRLGHLDDEGAHRGGDRGDRSEEHTSELQSRFGISYAVFC